MAQTTAGITPKGMVVSFSSDGAAWTDMSGMGVSVEPTGAARAFSELHTFEGDTPIVGTGKLSAADVTVKGVLTPTDAEFFDFMFDAKVADSAVYIKYSPAGGASGDKEYTVQGKCIECTPPGGEAGSSDIILAEARIVGAAYAEAVVA